MNRIPGRTPGHSARTLRPLHLMAACFLLSVLLQSNAFSQQPDPGTETALIVTGTLTGIFVVLIFLIIFVFNGEIDGAIGFVRQAWRYVSARPVGDVRQFDEDYDGISELDNRVPPWFNYLFGATVVFAAIYFLNYHVWGASPLPRAEYEEELAAADVQRRVRIAAEGAINEDQLAPLTDETSLKEGKEKFLRNCVTCHGANAQGIVGPNLTDQYWLHGGGIKNVYTTIKNGIPAKGMISWKLVFTPKEIQQIASYVLSLQGSNPPNAKKAEGDLYVEPKVAVADTSAKQTPR